MSAVVVRTDASTAIGLGHALRCLVLTSAWPGTAVYLMADVPAAVERRIERRVTLAAAPGSRADAQETVALARDASAEWVIVDGYQFDGDYLRRLTAAGLQVLALDDHGHAGRYPVRLVLNQNFGADAALYARRAADTRLLLGPRYALLRDEFGVTSERTIADRAERVLVTLGGSDPDNVSARVVAALAAVAGPLEVQVLIGAANPHRTALEAVATRSPHAVTLVTDARDVAARMSWADLAVAAAGGTARELACVGTPQVSIVLADNQRPAGAALAAADLAVVLGWHADVTEAMIAGAVRLLAQDRAHRAALSARGRALLDGRGARRVLDAMDPVA